MVLKLRMLIKIQAASVFLLVMFTKFFITHLHEDNFGHYPDSKKAQTLCVLFLLNPQDVS